MNVLMHIYYCYSSLNLHEIDLTTNSYNKDFIFDENSFSATNYELIDLLDDSTETLNFVPFDNSQDLVGLNFTNEIKFDFADLIPNSSNDRKNLYVNICHNHQNINFIDDGDLKNKDNKIGLDDQQYYNIKALPNFKMSNIPFSDKIASDENMQLKRKFQESELSFSKNNQQFLKLDDIKLKNLTDEPVIKHYTSDKNDNLSTYNTASTSADHFNKSKTDELKNFKSDFKATRTNVENNITVSETTKLNLLKHFMKKQLKQNKFEETLKTIKNADTIYINDEFNDLSNKIHLTGLTSSNYEYRIFEECVNIIQQDLLSTLRNAFEAIYEENEFINEQIRKLENSKENINMISKLKDTFYISQDLLTFEMKNFTRKFDQDINNYPLTAKLMEYSLTSINHSSDLPIALFQNRLFYLQRLLKKHRSCNNRSYLMEIIYTLKMTTNKALKNIFLAGMNSLFDKNNSYLEEKFRKTLVFLYLYKHGNKRFDIDWEKLLFKTLFSRYKRQRFKKDIWSLIKCVDSEIVYQGYLYINQCPFDVTNFLLSNTSENITYKKATKLLIEQVTRIKSKLYEV